MIENLTTVCYNYTYLFVRRFLFFMLMSKLFGERLKAKPAEANLISHIFLLRGGYIRPVGSGIYSMLTPCVRIQRKIEKIIREEMEKIGGQEVILPVVVPAELWKESGRFEGVGSELLRIKDRTGRDMVLSMTHEEAAVNLAKSEAKSYINYPFMIYQIQTKFRDEPRARGGLIRVREFTMKDGYSFHTSFEDLDEYYDKVYKAYEKIFERIGLNVVPIYSDTGMMGGTGAHEFMLLSEAGEDSIVICDECEYKANIEVATSQLEDLDDESLEKEKTLLYTPSIKTIDDLTKFLKISQGKIVKAVVYYVNNLGKAVIVFIRGDLEVNEAKLRSLLQSDVKALSDLGSYGLTEGFVGPDDEILSKFKVFFDKSLKGQKDMVVGANKTDYHFTGFSFERDLKLKVKFDDLSKVKEGQKCPICGSPLKIKRGIEMANIFKLGTKYTKSMDMKYVDKDGTLEVPIMGCYGIGIGRLIAGIIEASHDDFGPIWPKNIAPWQIQICALNINNASVKEKAFEIYEKLKENYEVIIDDRNLSAGAQFADADLLGIPIRIIVSKRNIENKQVEIVTRFSRESNIVDYDELYNFIDNFYKK